MYSYYFENIAPFNLSKTMQCGQCFRWHMQSSGSFIGVINGEVFELTQINDNKIFVETTMYNSKEFLHEYLGLNQNYNILNQKLAKNINLRDAIKYSKGIRILNQEHFECLISYIISANNMVPRIQKSVEKISQMFGEAISYKGNTYYKFPTPAELSCATKEQLRLAGVGFRDRYIIETTQNICSNKINLNEIGLLPTDELRKALLVNKGVGRKVADCVMLYSYHRYEVFPVDVWIKRVMENIFFNKKEVKNLNLLQSLAKEEFGELAGLANLYLFCYARENKIIN